MSRLGDPSLRGEICFLGVNNEFYNLLPITIFSLWATEHGRVETCHVADARASGMGQDSHRQARDSGILVCARSGWISTCRYHDCAGHWVLSRWFSGAHAGESTLAQGEWICFPPFKVATWEVNSIKVVCALKNVFHFWHWLDWFSKNYVNKNS